MSELVREIYRYYNKFFLRQPLVQRVVLGLFAFLIILTVVLIAVIPPQLNITVGQTSTRTIYAPHNIEDQVATEKARVQAEQSVPDAYVRERQLEQQVVQNLNSIGNTLLNNQNLTIDELKQVFDNSLPTNIASKMERFSDSTLNHILKTDPEHLEVLNAQAEEVILAVYEEGIRSIDSGLALIQYQVDTLELTMSDKLYIESLLYAVYQPSYTYSPELTNELKQTARQSVLPVIIHKGDLIVLEGQIITENTYALLETSGLLSSGRRTQMVLGATGFLIIVFVITISFIRTFCSDIYNNISSLVMYTLILVIGVSVSALLIEISPYLLMGVTVGVLITVLLDWRGAVIAVVAHNAMLAPLISDNILAIVIATISGITAVISSHRMNQRADMIRIALFVSAVNAAIVTAMQMLNGVLFTQIALDALIAIAGGIAFVIMAIGSLPFFENTFGIVSTVRLLELSNPNRPLLRRLLVEAPGTYNHSIVMGNLAEAAAEAVGADPLLARVGAYYHDIGKLKRPGLFVENQLNEESPHEKYAPSLSTLIITSHIKDGIEMATQARLPQPVIDIIAQHHGTTLVSYFYHKAIEQSPEGEKIREIDYRYVGPKPQTKEAGIIMLSDAIEAAVRALKRRSPTKVEEVVRKIIKSRLNDGELDECDLTMRDLDKLAETYIRALSGVYHNRIAYPERSIADLERSRKLGRHSN